MSAERRNEKSINVGMRNWMHEMLKEVSERDDRSIAEVIRFTLKEHYPELDERVGWDEVRIDREAELKCGCFDKQNDVEKGEKGEKGKGIG